MPERELERDELVITEREVRLKRPPLYKVLIHNDNYTTMEFVVYILREVFNRAEGEAVLVMLQVHREGVGVAGIYTYEVAEMKAAKVKALAEANEFPLMCTIEEAEASD